MFVLRNKKANILLSILFSIMLTGIIIGATSLIFDIDMKTINARYDKLQSNDIYSSVNLIKSSIKDGHLTRYEKVSDGVIANNKELKIQTSYFSSNASKVDFFNIKCPSNNQPLYYQINNNTKIKIVDNVTNCSFEYIDTVGEETNDIQKISAIKMSFDYQLPKKQKESVVLYQKMMQNS